MVAPLVFDDRTHVDSGRKLHSESVFQYSPDLVVPETRIDKYIDPELGLPFILRHTGVFSPCTNEWVVQTSLIAPE